MVPLLDHYVVVLVGFGERFPSFWPPDHLEIELRTVEREEREIRVRRLELPRG